MSIVEEQREKKEKFADRIVGKYVVVRHGGARKVFVVSWYEWGEPILTLVDGDCLQSVVLKEGALCGKALFHDKADAVKFATASTGKGLMVST